MENRTNELYIACKLAGCQCYPDAQVIGCNAGKACYWEMIKPETSSESKLSEYDSRTDTLIHIKRVSQLLTEAAAELIRRANIHDNSKLQFPEKKFFDEFTPKLAGCTYGSDEYKSYIELLKPALEHHYAKNSHHPEHYPNGINDFDLFDLIEMFFDWKAATERHNDGNIYKSITINQDRFKISDQICCIFENTAKRLNY